MVTINVPERWPIRNNIGDYDWTIMVVCSSTYTVMINVADQTITTLIVHIL